MVNVRLFV